MTTMGDMIFEDYRLDMVSRRCAPATIRNFDRVTGCWTAWLEANGVRPSEARKAHVQAFFNERESWGPRTKMVAKKIISAAYQLAVDDELIERNPCRRVRLEAIPQHVPRIIPSAVIRSIKDDLRDEQDQLLFSLFAYTGLRSIEVRRLTWPDVSHSEGLLLVNGKGQKQRHVPIHPALRAALVGHLWGQGSTYVVPGLRGGMVGHTTLWARMQRIYGGRDIQTHDWRRTVGTSLRVNGVQESVLKWMLGWSDPSVFGRHYNVVSTQEMQQAIRRLYLDDPI